MVAIWAGLAFGLSILVVPVSLPTPARSAGLPSAIETGTTSFVLRVPVLYYHRISCPPPDAQLPSMYTCPARLDEQLRYLRNRGWRAITVDDLADLMAERRCPGRKRFVISFDDGYHDAYTQAAPILEALGMRGSFFVSPGRADDERFMTYGQMRDLIARGHAIGNHSLSHLNLNLQPADVLYEQVEYAQQLLESELGSRPRTFAYPYGNFNNAVVQRVRDSGFELAFTVRRGARESTDKPLLSKRIRPSPKESGSEVLARIKPYADGCPLTS